MRPNSCIPAANSSRSADLDPQFMEEPKMLNFDPTRREVLLGSAAATVLLTTRSRNTEAAGQPLRPDIGSAAGQTMTDLYATAVKAMQAPEINYPPQPQSWTFQAHIHAVPLNPFDPANSGGVRGKEAIRKRVDIIYGNPAAGTPQAAWKAAALACWATCTHESPYFPTWHRWYLYYFERICRKMCGHPEFVLPYWNYASDTGPSLQLPAKFQERNLKEGDLTIQNHLFFDDRGLGFADGAGSSPQNVAMNNGGFMPFSQTQYGPALGAKVMFPSDDRKHMSF